MSKKFLKALESINEIKLKWTEKSKETSSKWLFKARIFKFEERIWEIWEANKFLKSQALQALLQNQLRLSLYEI